MGLSGIESATGILEGVYTLSVQVQGTEAELRAKRPAREGRRLDLGAWGRPHHAGLRQANRSTVGLPGSRMGGRLPGPMHAGAGMGSGT